jgi:hypothetical protein
MAPAVPDPPRHCRDYLTTVRTSGEDWFHVWRDDGQRSSTDFNPGHGRGRFHPINDVATDPRTPIPTFYAAETEDAAIFESVFHDIAEATPDQRVYRKDYIARRLSVARLARDVSLVDLRTTGRHRARVSREQLLTPVGRHGYSRTARWAEHFHRCCPTADGILWPSRRHEALAMMLFGDRAEDAVSDGGRTIALDTGVGANRILEIAEEADIVVGLG